MNEDNENAVSKRPTHRGSPNQEKSSRADDKKPTLKPGITASLKSKSQSSQEATKRISDSKIARNQIVKSFETNKRI